VNDCNIPRLERTVNEAVEAALLDLLTCPAGEVPAARQALCGLLAEVDYDREGLTRRAGLAIVSLHGGERRRRWELVAHCALEVVTRSTGTANKRDNQHPEENVP
jgi:hypothetical protein